MLAATLVVSSCGLPRSGPDKTEVMTGSIKSRGNAFVVPVTDRINRIAGTPAALGFSDSFRDAGQLGSDTIRPGDTLGLTIWENVDDGLLVAEGQNATALEEVQVDGSGFIFVPYAGRIRAAGNTPEAVRRIVTEKLDEQTPDPQVEVRRLAGNGATVSVTGAVGGQGVYPIERPTRTLGTMLAQAGGVAVPPEIARVTLTRGARSVQVWFDDLYADPGHDIALRAGDSIFVEQDRRSFTALGATGGQSRVPFESQAISAMEALAQVGGLNPTLADPTGVFVLRYEPERIARQVLDRDDLKGRQRMIYVLDLTAPNGLFVARDFEIRDDDTVYVTEAPFTQFNKTISALTGTLGQTTAAADTLSGL
ncbi:polysaccharide biosynthesis/export family protein [Roseovarius sp. SYSU LYC5161]|jgi:polysaccharide export outer membrane protein|uniref:polysaccharide biosynthesis/export family protein n=1 Tax=Roseovarius halophilus (ex Wu et al. 2025) TaxID=3376060 RepID=UPI00399A9109